jgi:hypothetical protein
VTEILQQAGVLGTNIDAQKTSPSALHRLLEPLSQQKRVLVQTPAAQRTMALDFKLPTT